MYNRITNKKLLSDFGKIKFDYIYPIVFLDAIYYKVTSDGKIVNKEPYIVMGIDINIDIVIMH